MSMSRQSPVGDALEHLRATDRALRRGSQLASLCPGRAEATPLATLGQELLAADEHPQIARAFAWGLCGIAQAIKRNFPGNLFWDLDFLAARLLEVDAAAPAAERVESMEQLTQSIISLQNLFSHASRIQFRYAHDFLYGFDWVKWVARDPATRAHAGPFAHEFLRGMQERGAEILSLIAQDDDKYPHISPNSDRNPFRFVRDPRAEELLHRDLAERDLLPLAAWSARAEPVWNRPYAELRNERALSLGLSERGALSAS
ncbi:MAG TPA: ferrochelatase [Polyangiaceae bacterium]|nr:ferrochelatase [Polyangiaceae bacterium]